MAAPGAPVAPTTSAEDAEHAALINKRLHEFWQEQVVEVRRASGGAVLVWPCRRHGRPVETVAHTADAPLQASCALHLAVSLVQQMENLVLGTEQGQSMDLLWRSVDDKGG